MAEQRPLPAILENAPEIFHGLGIFLSAFWDLSLERRSDEPIRRSSMLEWAASVDLRDDEEFCDDLIYFTRVLDREFMRVMDERRETKRRQVEAEAAVKAGRKGRRGR